MSAPVLLTDRLLLRQWRDGDRQPFAAMNADPRVMEYFPAVLTRTESDSAVDRMHAALERDGYGLWVVERLTDGAFLGFTGLASVPWSAPFTPAIEIGWRLAVSAWGNGYATEGARAVLEHAWLVLGLDEVVSFTAVGNHRSRRVMERLGMTRDPADDFDNPRLPAGHPLRRHVLYRIVRPVGPMGGPSP